MRRPVTFERGVTARDDREAARRSRPRARAGSEDMVMRAVRYRIFIPSSPSIPTRRTAGGCRFSSIFRSARSSRQCVAPAFRMRRTCREERDLIRQADRLDGVCGQGVSAARSQCEIPCQAFLWHRPRVRLGERGGATGSRVVGIAWDDVRVEVRDPVAESVVVHLDGQERCFQCAADDQYLAPVGGGLVVGQLGRSLSPASSSLGSSSPRSNWASAASREMPVTRARWMPNQRITV